MESRKDLNKGEGFIGSFYVDGIHSRIHRLKEVDAGRNPNPDVNLRKLSRGLQNPNAPFEGSNDLSGRDVGLNYANQNQVRGFEEIVYSVSDIPDFNPSSIRVVSDFFKVSLLTPVDIYKFVRDLNSDRIESLLSDDNDSTSEKPTPEPSTNDSEVFGVRLNTMKDYEAFNTTLTSVEGVTDFFGVSLKTQVDYENFANGIEIGTYEVWSKLTSKQRKAILKTASVGWTALMELKSATPDLGGSPKMFASVLNPGLGVAEKPVSPSDPIVKSVDIHEKPSSFVGAAGASAKDQPKVNSNFRPLVADPVFDGVNISIPRKVVKKVSTRFEHTLYGHFIGKRMAFPVVEYYARNNWAKHGLKRIMMNTKGFFFFKFDSRAGLEAVLERGPWLIRKSPIILKKWSMDTRLLKEELTRIPIWVKLHDVPIQVFEEDDISLIATFIGKPVNSEADLVDVVTIGIPSLSEDDFTKETIRVEYEWRPPRCDTCKIFGHVHDYCPKKVASPPIVATSNVVTPNAEKTNDGFQTVGKKKKRKGKSKSTNGGRFTGPLVKHNVRYEPKATTSAPIKGTTYVGYTSQSTPMLKTTGNSSKKDNLSMSNSLSALNEEEDDDEEDVENVYDESANLIQNTKAGGSSSFTAVVDPIYATYHDKEWGVPILDDKFAKKATRLECCPSASLKVAGFSYNFLVRSIPKCLGYFPRNSFQGNYQPIKDIKQRTPKQCGATEERFIQSDIRCMDKDEAVGKKSKIIIDRDCDISEEVSLVVWSLLVDHMLVGGEVMYDQRLFNHEKGMKSNFITNDQYNAYDKAQAISEAQGQSAIYITYAHALRLNFSLCVLLLWIFS
ncbi:zinc knuckle CX2CX4HX4C containing protein [Tanacetum coccineum]